MPLKLLRLYALLFISAYCIGIFILGLVTKVSFFNTFIGPAAILLYIAFKPNFYYDIIAVSTIVLLTIIALIFAVVSAMVNHEYALAFFVPAVPIAVLTIVIYCMDKLKKEDELYS
ncbi:MAG: hypothetical protein SCH71_10150 [Desulfobulbaceae bacterium]|nr:hypothetical protein [Desulfobulbaceae bacterium]